MSAAAEPTQPAFLRGHPLRWEVGRWLVAALAGALVALPVAFLSGVAVGLDLPGAWPRAALLVALYGLPLAAGLGLPPYFVFGLAALWKPEPTHETFVRVSRWLLFLEAALLVVGAVLLAYTEVTTHHYQWLRSRAHL